eukprot:6204548-Pleurochrysis_carterae.AAC.2
MATTTSSSRQVALKTYYDYDHYYDVCVLQVVPLHKRVGRDERWRWRAAGVLRFEVHCRHVARNDAIRVPAPLPSALFDQADREHGVLAAVLAANVVAEACALRHQVKERLCRVRRAAVAPAANCGARETCSEGSDLL